MALSDSDAAKRAASMLTALDADLDRDGAKGVVDRYLKGDQDLPYIPKGAATEYKRLAARSITPWLPLISDNFVKALFVDGYRASTAKDNAKPWDYWQANGLDARQSIAHRGALEHGQSLVSVLPGDPAPVIRPYSPLRTHALYSDPDADFPEFGIVTDGRTGTGERIVRLFDAEAVYTFTKAKESAGIDDRGRFTAPRDVGRLTLASTEEHGLGVTPLVRFRDRLDGDAIGIVRPLVTLQDRVNEVVFALLMALQYASHRQRWATGLAIPTTTVTDPDGSEREVPVETFEAAVNRLWVTDNPEAKFGDFAQTDVSGHLRAYEEAVRTLSAIAQTSPLVLMGDVSNVSAEALAAHEATSQRKSGEHETLFGESWEQVFRLAASAAGDEAGAADVAAQVRWRDTEARSLAQTVDALGKLAQMLSVPVEALWERVPGVTAQDVEHWKALRQEGDVFGALVSDLTRQSSPAIEAPTA